jgi:hypothetical protein
MLLIQKEYNWLIIMSLADVDVSDIELSGASTTVSVNTDHSWIKLGKKSIHNFFQIYLCAREAIATTWGRLRIELEGIYACNENNKCSIKNHSF